MVNCDSIRREGENPIERENVARDSSLLSNPIDAPQSDKVDDTPSRSNPIQKKRFRLV